MLPLEFLREGMLQMTAPETCALDGWRVAIVLLDSAGVAPNGEILPWFLDPAGRARL